MLSRHKRKITPNKRNEILATYEGVRSSLQREVNTYVEECIEAGDRCDVKGFVRYLEFSFNLYDD